MKFPSSGNKTLVLSDIHTNSSVENVIQIVLSIEIQPASSVFSYLGQHIGDAELMFCLEFGKF